MSIIGFIGSGNVGQALARAVIGRGHEVIMSNSRGPSTLSALIGILGQRARAGSTADAIEQADIVVLAIPFTSIDQLPAAALKGKVVVDATNYWAPRDGHIAVIDSGVTTSSEMIAERLPGARIVKAFNSIMATDISQHARPRGRAGRRATPIAGDYSTSKEIGGSHRHGRFRRRRSWAVGRRPVDRPSRCLGESARSKGDGNTHANSTAPRRTEQESAQ